MKECWRVRPDMTQVEFLNCSDRDHLPHSRLSASPTKKMLAAPFKAHSAEACMERERLITGPISPHPKIKDGPYELACHRTERNKKDG